MQSKFNQKKICLLFFILSENIICLYFSRRINGIEDRKKRITNVTNQPNATIKWAEDVYFLTIQISIWRRERTSDSSNWCNIQQEKKHIHRLIWKMNDIQLTFVKTWQMRLTTRLSDDNKVPLLSQYQTEPIGLYK